MALIKQNQSKKRGWEFYVGLVLLLLMATVPLSSLKEYVTKNKIQKELIGTWTGSSTLVYITFYSDNKFEINQIGLHSIEVNGRYHVNGRNVSVSWHENGEDWKHINFRLSEDHYLYASDGTKYVKVHDFK